MSVRRRTAQTPTAIAMLGAAAVSAQFVAGKAARDAIYLANLDVTTLPAMVIAAAAVSIAAVSVQSRSFRHVPAGTLVTWMFTLSALLLTVEWALTLTAPRVAAPLLYLHMSGVGPLLGSGFWLVLSESFDPHTARQEFGRIAGMGALGGLAAGLAAERLGAVAGAAALLPCLAAASLFCAFQVRRLAASAVAIAPRADAASDARSGLAALANAPYLRNLAAVVLVGTLGATVLDYLFKTRALDTFGRGDALLRFFALYYAGVSVLTFLLQKIGSAKLLETAGLGAAAAAPAAALVGGSVANLVFPGFATVILARAGESISRGSLYRAAYEIFFTPVSVSDKRAAKTVIDVGFDRLGDALGGGVLRVLLLLPAVQQPLAFNAFTIACALFGMAAAARLNRGYIETLERRLRDRVVELDLGDVRDLSTKSVVLKTLTLPVGPGPLGSDDLPTRSGPADTATDQVSLDVAALRSRSRREVLRVLERNTPLEPGLIMHVIPLLSRESVHQAAVLALHQVADRHVGTLADAILDRDQPFAVRRRLARILSSCTTQRAVDALTLALNDHRFEVRYHSARSLGLIHERSPELHVDPDAVLRTVLREVASTRAAWEEHRLEDPGDAHFSWQDGGAPLQAGLSLAHVFTLLSLVLPSEPLRIAFRGLNSDDEQLRGTALEYLDGILPVDIRARLWPLLDVPTDGHEQKRGSSPTV